MYFYTMEKLIMMIFFFFLLQIVAKEALNKAGICRFYKGQTLGGGNLVSGVY